MGHPNQIKYPGVPYVITGPTGSITGSTIGADPHSAESPFKDSTGKTYYLACGVQYKWNPPWSYDTRTDLRPPYNNGNQSPMPTSPGPTASNCWVKIAYTLEADFDACLMVGAPSVITFGPAKYMTPGLPRRTIRYEHIGPYQTGYQLIYIGGYSTDGYTPEADSGSYRLSWDYSPYHMIGDIMTECPAFSNTSAEYVGRCIIPPFPGNQNRIYPAGFNFLGHPSQSFAKFFFNPSGTFGMWSLHDGEVFPSGTYLVVSAGGAYRIEQTGWPYQTDTPLYVNSIDSVVHTIENGFYEAPHGDVDFTHQRLIYSGSNGMVTSSMPVAGFSTFPDNAISPQHMAPWSMRYYQKTIQHCGGKIWIETNGGCGWSDTSGSALYTIRCGLDGDGSTAKTTTLTAYDTDPKWFLYRVNG